MHNPSQAAHIVVPQAPLGNTTNGKSVLPGMGMKALLAKKMAKSEYAHLSLGMLSLILSSNPKFVSPTDNMVTPVTQKLNAAKQKRFAKYVIILDLFHVTDNAFPRAKPTGKLFADKEMDKLDEQQGESDPELSDSKSPTAPAHEDANPFE